MKKPAFEGRANSVATKTILAKTLNIEAFYQASFHLELLHKIEPETEIRCISKGGKLPTLEFKFPKQIGWDYENKDQLIKANLEGRGIYFVVNDGGTTDIEITQCRAFFIEWDDRPKEDQLYIYRELGLPIPTFQLDTGGKSIHNYWVLKKPVSQLIWSPIQKRLIDYTNSDKQIKNPSRVMRLAGFYHVKDGKPTEQSKLINITQKEYSVKDIEDVLPEPEVHKDVKLEPSLYKDVKRTTTKGDWTLREIIEALDHIPTRVTGNNTYEEYRNMAWGLTDLLEQMGHPESLAIQLLEAHSPSGEVSNWDVEQVVRSRKGHIKAGTFIRIAQKHGWKPKAK